VTTLARVLVLLAAMFLLTSLGGAAVFGAPVTLPLLYVSVRTSPAREYRFAGTLVAVLTSLELGWTSAYVVAGEHSPLIWLMPTRGALGTLYVFEVRSRRGVRDKPA
jgi:hypothetical protein